MTPQQPAAQQEPPRASPSIEADLTQVEAEVHASEWKPVDKPWRGILLVLISTIFLASSDAMAKYLSVRLHAIEIGWLRYLVFMLIMCPAVIATSPRRALHSVRPDLQLLRGLTLVGSSMLFISALRVLPIAEATTTGFVSPIFVTALSILFLRESVGLRRWLATLTGLIGVMIVARPGTSAFHPAALLAILSALCWACSLVITRKISGRDTAVTTMTYSAITGFVLLSIMLPFFWIAPTPREIAIGVCIGIAATTGHWLVVIAYRYADASVLAPFSYSQLICATVLGYFIFGDVPDAWTFTGAAVIIASGLYIAHRERVRRSGIVLKTATAKV